VKIIVTGGSGFIGTNLITRLLSEQGWVIKNIDINKPKNLKQIYLWDKCDILDRKSLKSIFQNFNPEIVIHLAARTDLNSKLLECYKSNTLGLENLIHCCNTTLNLKRVIFTSSMLVCRLGYIPVNDQDWCPTTAYGQSKVKGEQLVRSQINCNIEWIIVRPTSLWGPWFEKPYINFFNVVRAGYFMMPRNLKVYRSYGFILNSVDQLISLIKSKHKDNLYKVYYISDYETIELMEWAQEIIKYSKQGRVYKLPWLVLKILAVIGDCIQLMGFKSVPLTSFRLNNMATNAIINNDKLREICGPQKYSMKDGVAITIDWLEQNK
jgi:GlcNAc-P-P-Und epimerase